MPRLDYRQHAEAMLTDLMPEGPGTVLDARLFEALRHRIAVLMDDATEGLCDITTDPRGAEDW